MRFSNLLLPFFGVAPLAAQAVTEAAHPPENVLYRVSQEADSLGGPGGKWLLDRARAAQLVLFGEQHFVDGIAEFVTGALLGLADADFRFLVLEAGDWTGEQFARHGTDATIRSAPHALAFDSNGDIALLRVQESRWPDVAERVAGIDQEGNAVHPLQHIAATAPNMKSRRIARGLFLKAALLGGGYIRTDNSADLRRLRESIGTDSEDPAAKLVQSLLDSMSIYVAHRFGSRNQSVKTRETRMMRLFDEYMGRLEAAGQESPHVLFKMGGAHTMKGIGPNLIETLGEHVRRYAVAHGTRSFHVGIRRWTTASPISLPAAMRSSSAVVVDCAAWSEAVSAEGGLESLPATVQSDIRKYDALVYLPGAGTAPKDVIRGKEKEFRNSVLWMLAPMAGLILVQVLTWVHGGWWWWRRRRASGEFSPWPWMGLHFAWLTLTLVLAWQFIQILRSPRSTAPVADGLVLMIHGAWALAWIAFAALAFLNWHKRVGSPSGRVYFAICVLAFGCTLGLVHWWNVGGMLATP